MTTFCLSSKSPNRLGVFIMINSIDYCLRLHFAYAESLGIATPLDGPDPRNATI